MAVFSQRSKGALEGVHPNLVKVLNEAIKSTPIDFTIIEGVRTQATQQKYYSWGRTAVNPNSGSTKTNKFGLVVTFANGTTNKSNHQIKADGYGHAIDFCPFVNGKLDWDNHANFKVIADHIVATGKKLDIKITAGFYWKKPYDPPHIQLG